jgi:mannose-6-phosphate isomerase-like protein (cupin superfamily)
VEVRLSSGGHSDVTNHQKGPVSMTAVAHLRTPFAEPRTEERPWGSFTLFALNEPASVKIITVAAGGRLSLQRHGHRAETWLVLDAGLEVLVGDRQWIALPGEVVNVPCGAVHRMSATGGAVRVLEVVLDQFDEDDIERLDDAYGRC